jgi:drug/metabolite transporter (DMT)-like permease
LALSTVPLLTILAGAILRVERPTPRRTAGVAIAMAGVAVTLARSLAVAPPDAWRGDIIMVVAALCMALYNVWSRPFIARSGALPFATCGMGVGAALLSTISLATGGAAKLAGLDTTQWLAVAYLAGICGALIFFLWAFALGRTSPTLVSISVAVNPISAALLGTALLDEPVGIDLAIGLITVLVGIGIAGPGTQARTPKDERT